MDRVATDQVAAASALSRRQRWALFAVAWIFFGLGVIGLLLPVVPTTPFMLLSLWAFSRSSPRFHEWLYHHRVFGPPLQRWRRDRVIPWWTKALALASMAASLGYVAAVIRPPWYALLAMAAVVAAGIAYVARLPTRAGPPSS